ncbi:hypothetical protein AB205_0151500 [Aquarana catesbeiana]|uniref:Uncharacterized protein n=1 Tax=Aquarana catesbeiana TaxID=8400 RepID=A0A2G9SC16_AQUCT|nr:hypothetical protein AB205_0151500 [Aquarana catesbeiana]
MTADMQQEIVRDREHNIGVIREDHCFYSLFTNQSFHLCAPYSSLKKGLLTHFIFLSARFIIKDQRRKTLKRKEMDSTKK